MEAPTCPPGAPLRSFALRFRRRLSVPQRRTWWPRTRGPGDVCPALLGGPAAGFQTTHSSALFGSHTNTDTTAARGQGQDTLGSRSQDAASCHQPGGDSGCSSALTTRDPVWRPLLTTCLCLWSALVPRGREQEARRCPSVTREKRVPSAELVPPNSQHRLPVPSPRRGRRREPTGRGEAQTHPLLECPALCPGPGPRGLGLAAAMQLVWAFGVDSPGETTPISSPTACAPALPPDADRG